MSQAVHQALLQQTSALPYLQQLLQANGIQQLSLQGEENFFPYLARSVAGQQLSNTAARTIWQRAESLLTNEQQFLDLFVESNREVLRGCGLSNAKIKTICGVREALEQRVIVPEELAIMPESEIVKTLTQLWGIGPWTAEMTAIFFFGLPDVWSKGDVALARGLALIAEKEGVSEQEILSTVTPYRSYFALHVWQSLDTDLFTSMAN